MPGDGFVTTGQFAFGDAAKRAVGFRLTGRPAAWALALAAGSHTPRAAAFGRVAPMAIVPGPAELLRAWGAPRGWREPV
jgi:hypothetical protein